MTALNANCSVEQAMLWPCREVAHWGAVSLVGAGPGDPELLTVRALRRLQAADVVVFDNLVGHQIMELVPANTARIYVGKKAADHALPQEAICALLVQLAQRGKRVVRLKGGDPFVFGRGGEELEALAQAGVVVEVVPGITAALGASAGSGIPLTHRDLAQSCVFVTGYRKDGGDVTNWASLARPNQTLVVYMGVSALPGIVQALRAHGRAGSTPVALIRHASLPDQQVWTGSLDTIVDIAARHQIKPPALIVVGEVVALYQPGLQRQLEQAHQAWAHAGPRAGECVPKQ